MASPAANAEPQTHFQSVFLRKKNKKSANRKSGIRCAMPHARVGSPQKLIYRSSENKRASRRIVANDPSGMRTLFARARRARKSGHCLIWNSAKTRQRSEERRVGKECRSR